MNDFSIKYAYTLDDIRRQKKITITNLCDGICSDRQYRRYMSGEHLLSQEKIYTFCEKLGISPGDFFYASLSKDKFDYRELYTLYSFLLSHQFDKFLV
ncbi:MAG: helix-turn-helix domain-containing protein, partial [Candidatus Izemoplasma sp.]